MAFEGLSDKLSAAFKRLRSKGKLSEADVKEARVEGFKSWRNGLETLPAGWAANRSCGCLCRIFGHCSILS